MDTNISWLLKEVVRLQGQPWKYLVRNKKEAQLHVLAFSELKTP